MGPSESVPRNVRPELRREDVITPAFPEPQLPASPSASRLAWRPGSEVRPEPRSAPRGSSVGAAVLGIPACPSKPQQPLVIVENDSCCPGKESQASIGKEKEKLIFMLKTPLSNTCPCSVPQSTVK